MKHLNLIFSIPATYTFAGDNRDGSSTVASDTAVTPKLLNTNNGGSEAATITGSTPFKIKRARLISSGAVGLQPAQGKIAGEIKLSVNTSSKNYGVDIALAKWNEWEEKNIVVGIGLSKEVSFSVLKDSVVRVDDFNVADAFIGQDIVPMLEIEAEIDEKGYIR